MQGVDATWTPLTRGPDSGPYLYLMSTNQLLGCECQVASDFKMLLVDRSDLDQASRSIMPSLLTLKCYTIINYHPD